VAASRETLTTAAMAAAARRESTATTATTATTVAATPAVTLGERGSPNGERTSDCADREDEASEFGVHVCHST
jgi:hypothetical protein